MSLLLEVIVQSVADARAAAAGGADRLEVVRDIDRDGLTPSIELVRAIAAETPLPLRVMVRERDGFSIVDRGELAILQKMFAAFGDLGVDGVVLGFAIGRELDLEATSTILAASPSLHVTFHRAFDEAADPTAAIQALQSVPQVDRILTAGGLGDWKDRCQRLNAYATLAGPGVKILAGSGVDAAGIRSLIDCRFAGEVHVGRAAREPQLRSAPVSAERVRELKAIAASDPGAPVQRPRQL